MTLTLDVAIEEERTARREKAIQLYAQYTVNTEAEMARLQAKIEKVRSEVMAIPDFNNPVVVDDIIKRYQQY